MSGVQHLETLGVFIKNLKIFDTAYSIITDILNEKDASLEVLVWAVTNGGACFYDAAVSRTVVEIASAMKLPRNDAINFPISKRFIHKLVCSELVDFLQKSKFYQALCAVLGAGFSKIRCRGQPLEPLTTQR